MSQLTIKDQWITTSNPGVHLALSPMKPGVVYETDPVTKVSEIVRTGSSSFAQEMKPRHDKREAFEPYME